MLEGIDGEIKMIDADTGQTLAFTVLLDEKTLAEQRFLSRWLRFAMKWTDLTPSITGSQRMSGIKYPNRVFGYTEPKPLRRRYSASASSLYREFPDVAQALDNFTVENWRLFAEEEPEIAAEHLSLISDCIHEDWWIAGKPWTSGIINHTAALPYHKDSGNVSGTWSAMLSLRKDVTGGALHMPEYDVTIAIPNASVTFFDGQGTWHGVTPMVKQKPDGYRYTLVWYTKNGFKKCGSKEEEAHNGQLRATR